MLNWPFTETVACNLCGADDSHPVDFPERYGTAARMVLCRRCGLGFLNPRWSADDYGKFYEQEYRAVVEETSLEHLAERQRINAAHIVRQCAPFLAARPRVLDAGSSTGALLHVFRTFLDADVLGIEPSRAESDYAARVFDVPSFRGMLEAFTPDAPASFDLVIINQTLNHLLDPAGSLQKVRSLLSPRGLLFVQVQNFPEFARLRKRPIKVDHTYYFSVPTLIAMLRRTGFSPLLLDVDTLETRQTKDAYLRQCIPSIHIHVLAQQATPQTDRATPDGEAAILLLEKILDVHRNGERGDRSYAQRALRRFQGVARRLRPAP